MPTLSVYALGDVHGNVARLLQFLEKARPNIVLQTGDFGLTPRATAGQQSVHVVEKHLYTLPVLPKIYWCDGNHERWGGLSEALYRASPEQRLHGIPLTEHLIWMPRGSWLTLPDGRTVLFAGGAKSADWKLRMQHGLPWAAHSEQLQAAEINTPCPQPDIVISHTAPLSLQVPGIDDLTDAALEAIERQKGWDLSADPSRAVLETLYQRHRPARWLCGHFHRYADIVFETTHFTVLDCLAGYGHHGEAL